MHKRWLILLVIVGIIAAPLLLKVSRDATAQRKQRAIRQAEAEDRQKEAEIRQIMELIGMRALTQQALSDFMATNRARYPQFGEDFWRQSEKEYDIAHVMEEFIPVYEKYLTLSELRDIRSFYAGGQTQQEAFFASETGQKVQRVYPQIRQEGAELGRAHYRRILVALENEARRLSTNSVGAR